MKLTETQEVAINDTAPCVLVVGDRGRGKTTAVIAKALTARHACVIVNNHWSFDDAMMAWVRATSEAWTYVASQRRWSRGDQTIDVIPTEDLKSLRGRSGYDVVCVDTGSPAMPPEATQAVRPGGQLYMTVDGWSVHSLNASNPYLAK